MKRLLMVLGVVALLVTLTGAAVLAAVTFDAATGTGFVGKGDVQLALGWNNKQLQDNAASVTFSVESTVVSEVTWVCTKDNGNTQERARTTTTSVQGVLSSVLRERNQVTGFILAGYSGDPTTSSSAEGPALNSCPTNWELTTQAGDPEIVSSTSALTVNGVPLQ